MRKKAESGEEPPKWEQLKARHVRREKPPHAAGHLSGCQAAFAEKETTKISARKQRQRAISRKKLSTGKHSGSRGSHAGAVRSPAPRHPAQASRTPPESNHPRHDPRIHRLRFQWLSRTSARSPGQTSPSSGKRSAKDCPYDRGKGMRAHRLEQWSRLWKCLCGFLPSLQTIAPLLGIVIRVGIALRFAILALGLLKLRRPRDSICRRSPCDGAAPEAHAQARQPG